MVKVVFRTRTNSFKNKQKTTNNNHKKQAKATKINREKIKSRIKQNPLDKQRIGL